MQAGGIALCVATIAACAGPGPSTGDGARSQAPPQVIDVPARPQLSYSVRQRDEIGDALIADRENALYDRDTVLYRTGQRATPAERAAQPRESLDDGRDAAQRPARPPNFEADIVARRVEEERDADSLSRFLTRLEREPAPVVIERAQRAAEIAAENDAAPRPQPVEPEPRTSETRLLDEMMAQLSALFGFGDVETVPTDAGEEPALATTAAVDLETGFADPVAPAAAFDPAVREGFVPALELAFDSADPDLGTSDSARVQSLAHQLVDTDQGALVVGHGDRPAVALDRARSVARSLIASGVPASALTLRAAGPGPGAAVFVAPARPS